MQYENIKEQDKQHIKINKKEQQKSFSIFLNT